MKYLFVYLDYQKENSKAISFHYVQTDAYFNIEKGNIVELNTKRNIQKVINKLTRKENKVIGYSKENIISLISLCKKKEIEFDEFDMIELKTLCLLHLNIITDDIKLSTVAKKFELNQNSFAYFNIGNLIKEIYYKLHYKYDITLGEYEHGIYSCSLVTFSYLENYYKNDTISYQIPEIKMSDKQFLFFDIECSNCFSNKGKICEFSYVITDQNFNIIKEKEYVINPGEKNTRFDFHLQDNKKKKGIHLKYEDNDYEEYRNAEPFSTYMDEIKDLLLDEKYIKFGFAVSNDISYLKYTFNRYMESLSYFYAYDVCELIKNITQQPTKGLEKISEILVENKDLKDLLMHSSLDDSKRTMLCLKSLIQNRNLSIFDVLINNESAMFSNEVKQVGVQSSNPDLLGKIKIFNEQNKRRKRYLAFVNKYLENKYLQGEVYKEEYIGKRFIVSSKVKEDKDKVIKIIQELLKCGYLLVINEEDADIYIFENEEDKNINEYYLNKKYICLTLKEINRFITFASERLNVKDTLKAAIEEEIVETLFKEEKYKEAFPHYLKIAKLGFIKYQRRMGEIYRDGIGTRKNKNKSRYFYELAASKGDRNAQYYLSLLYIEKFKDIKLGHKLLEKVAKRGYKKAIETIGNAYEYGELGYPVNFYKAKEWYEELTEVNLAKAYLLLGKLYANEEYEGYNLEKAYHYLELSALKKNPEAIEILENIIDVNKYE